MAKRMLSIMLIAVCIVICTACEKSDEPNIEPSVTVSELLKTLEDAGYVVKSNEETSTDEDYIEQTTNSIFFVSTNENGYIVCTSIDCDNFNEEEKDFIKTVWIKLLDDEALVENLVFDLQSEEYLKNGTTSQIERGNLLLLYFNSEMLDSVKFHDKNYEVSLLINTD